MRLHEANHLPATSVAPRMRPSLPAADDVVLLSSPLLLTTGIGTLLVGAIELCDLSSGVDGSAGR